MGHVIALLGAECTGKTTLAHALAAHWQAAGLDAVMVPEFLRQWCNTHQRTPQAHEQASIALVQHQRLQAAAAQHSLVIADTTPLMTAVYSDYMFANTSLYAQALAAQRDVDVTLLMGTDLPWQADGFQRDGVQAQQHVDALLRRVLEQAQLRFQSVVGSEPERLQITIKIIANFLYSTSKKCQKIT